MSPVAASNPARRAAFLPGAPCGTTRISGRQCTAIATVAFRELPSTSSTSSMRSGIDSNTSARSRALFRAGATRLSRSLTGRISVSIPMTVGLSRTMWSPTARSTGSCIRRDGHALSFLTLTSAPRSVFNWTVAFPRVASEAPHGPFSNPLKLVLEPTQFELYSPQFAQRIVGASGQRRRKKSAQDRPEQAGSHHDRRRDHPMKSTRTRCDCKDGPRPKESFPAGRPYGPRRPGVRR
jgi:hypothetical protein